MSLTLSLIGIGLAWVNLESDGLLAQSTSEALDTQARAELAAGNPDKAFELWFHELNQQRSFGEVAEIRALARVGEIAWDENHNDSLQKITQRLRVIQEGIGNSANREVLLALGEAFEKVRVPRQAVAVYTRLLEQERSNNSSQSSEELLTKIGQLHLSAFNYTSAAQVYEELLALAQSRQDTFSQTLYLQELSRIYSQSLQPENAVYAKEQLIQFYSEAGQFQQLPPLKIALGTDYESLHQPENARRNYQEAFELAWSRRQFSLAGEALQRLANLYYIYEEANAALEIYQELIKVQQQSYDYYGLMHTYDQMGKILLKQGNSPQALLIYRQALALSQSLGYLESYFLDLVESIEQS